YVLATFSPCSFLCPRLLLSLPSSSFSPDTAPTELYTLSLHDALPISAAGGLDPPPGGRAAGRRAQKGGRPHGVHHRPRRQESVRDRKSTRLNSSHVSISYAVFCLKKKKTKQTMKH